MGNTFRVAVILLGLLCPPTSIELGCADPNNPCNLPNALAGDPPLKQVVTRTWEAGIRNGAVESPLKWSAGWFRASNRDDLLFVASQQTGNGYFKNFGQTLRQGAEAHLSSRVRRFTLGGNYTFVRATYESSETVDGSSNSTNDSALAGAPGMDGVITVHPGDRIRLVPPHLLKAFADVQATARLSLDLDFVAAYRVMKRVEAFGQGNNLLNRHYYTAAQLGPTGFNNQGTFVARPFPAVDGNYPIAHATFYAPGAPIGAWGGLRFRF